MYEKFAEADGTVWGAYGPRLNSSRGRSQIDDIVAMLSDHVETRQAVIQIFHASDVVEDRKNVPCTCVLQFLARGGRLNLMVSMRSNDAYRGFPHDVFAFTMIQELVAKRLRLKLGWYKHFVGSMHLYDYDRANAEGYVAERWQAARGVAMPPMPINPSISVQRLLAAEATLRESNGDGGDIEIAALPKYWRDLAQVLRAYAWQANKRDPQRIRDLIPLLNFPVYGTYFEGIARRTTIAQVGA